jgi:DNA-binding transcriptional MerR regulator
MDRGGAFKIGVVSRRTGLSSATIRLWEEQYGLLTPARSSGQQRLYSEADVERIVYIRELISYHGYSLQAVASILDEARQHLPAPLHELMQGKPADPQAARLTRMADELRPYLEDVYLRMATHRDQIRESQLLVQVHSFVARSAQDVTYAEAATTLVAGSAALLGNLRTTLARYDRARDVLHWVASARDSELLEPNPEPWPVSFFTPPSMQQAFREGQPYYLPSIQRDELVPEAARRLNALGVQSVYAHPLRATGEVVALMVVSSRRLDGVSPEGRGLCARVAAISGPTLAYLAARESAVPGHN